MTSVVANVILIPRVGILGAGISNIAAYFVLATIVTLWARKVIGYSIDYVFTAKVVGATALMALCLYCLRIHGSWGILLGIMVGAAVFVMGLFALKSFSAQDKRLFSNLLKGVVPSFSKKTG